MPILRTSVAVLGLACAAWTLPAHAALDLSTYTRIGVYDLPVGHAGNQLAREASAVTWNWDTNTLFVIGDEGTALVEVSRTGQLLGSMQLTGYGDPEGLAYVGQGKFVIAEERTRVASKLGYAAGTSFAYAAAQNVKLGTTIGNIGHEGLSYDTVHDNFVFVKEKQPLGIFQTRIDFSTGTASNGAPTTVMPTNLFHPALLGLLDIADVASLSNVSALAGSASAGNLLVLSEESGKVLEVDRNGTILGRLDVGVPAQHEGITVDAKGNIYLVSELGGGNSDRPQLWVYAAPAAPVPEPATWAMMLAGLAGVAAFARRRRATKAG